jgi:hypothetical protein
MVAIAWVLAAASILSLLLMLAIATSAWLNAVDAWLLVCSSLALSLCICCSPCWLAASTLYWPTLAAVAASAVAIGVAA